MRREGVGGTGGNGGNGGTMDIRVVGARRDHWNRGSESNPFWVIEESLPQLPLISKPFPSVVK